MERKKITLLLIDASASFLFFNAAVLRNLGYTVISSRSAEDAITMMVKTVPSLIIADIHLSAMDGISFLKEIKKNPRLKDVPVVILTEETDPGKKDACQRAGCAAYLNKPVSPDMLYRTVQAASETVPRQFIRFSTSLKVSVGDGTAPGGAGKTEYATAISEGGLFISTLHPQPVDTVMPITIFLRDRQIPVKAVVLYQYTVGAGPNKEPGMGMRFTEISDKDRILIRAFIKDELTKDIDARGHETL